MSTPPSSLASCYPMVCLCDREIRLVVSSRISFMPAAVCPVKRKFAFTTTTFNDRHYSGLLSDCCEDLAGLTAAQEVHN